MALLRRSTSGESRLPPGVVMARDAGRAVVEAAGAMMTIGITEHPACSMGARVMHLARVIPRIFEW